MHGLRGKPSNRKIDAGIFLIDSGGQYEDGTTDITRTLAVKEVSADMRRHYTLVLKGHLAISRAVFPKGTSGAQIEGTPAMMVQGRFTVSTEQGRSREGMLANVDRLIPEVRKTLGGIK